MNPKLKKILKKTFPLGLLIAANNVWGKVANKFRYFGFIKEWKQFKEAAKKVGDGRFQLSALDLSPILHEKGAEQYFDRHYVYHLAWAARKIKEIGPQTHIDISSSLHFSTIVSAFVPVKFYDYRPADVVLSDLTSGQADLMKLDFPDNSLHSVSCMHTVEHIGLGRYGDPINPVADITAMKELQRVVAKGGNLLFVVPVGKPKVMFNSARTYSYEQIVGAFSELRLKEFTLLPDEGALIKDADKELVAKQVHGCGCFWFVK